MDLRTLAGFGLLALVLAACDGDKGIDGGTDDGGTDDGGDGGTGDGGTGDGGTGGDDCGGDIASACDFQIDDKTGGVEMEEVIGEAGDRDFYKISLGAGEMVAVGTLAYANDGDAEPDTVLRLYDSAGTLLATNDDMPFRLQETDSALYFQATTDADYYLEVLEWSDWDGTGDAAGGESYEYTLVAYLLPELDPEPDNDEAVDIDAWVDSNGSIPMYGNGWTDDGELPYQFFGDMDSATDRDLYPASFDTKDGSRVWCQFSLWPTTLGTLDPAFALYDSDGNVVAANDEPSYNLDRYYYYDGAVIFADQGAVFGMADEQSYYLSVSDEGGNQGVGTFYPGLMECYSWNTEVVTVEEVDVDNNVPTLSSDIIMNESTDGTAWYGYVAGGFDEMAMPEDELDALRISSATTGGSLDGKILNIVVQSVGIGQYADSAITVYASDGTTVLASESTNGFDGNADAAIENLELEGAGSAIYVAIENEGSMVVPDANQYVADRKSVV